MLKVVRTLEIFAHEIYQRFERLRVSAAELVNQVGMERFNWQEPYFNTTLTDENKIAVERIKKDLLPQYTLDNIQAIWVNSRGDENVQRLHLCSKTVTRELVDYKRREVHYQGRQLKLQSGDLLTNLKSEFIDQAAKARTFQLKKGKNRSKELKESDLLYDKIYLADPDHPTPEEEQLLALLQDKKAVLELIQYWGEIIADPLLFFGYLRDLDKDLQDIQAPEKPFDFVMMGKGSFLPGPRKASLKPMANADQLLSETLLKREQSRGINRDGVPRYIGAITRDISDELVASGHVFEDDPLISRLLLHGPYSHRFQIEMLAQSLKKHPTLSAFPPAQILNLLLSVRVQGETTQYSLWDYLIDNVGDMILPGILAGEISSKYLDPENYATSNCSPMVLNPNLLCFGDQLGLPHLQYLLLETFWNAADELKRNVKEHSEDEERLYLALFASHQCCKGGFSDIESPMPGSLTSEERMADPKLYPFPGNPHMYIKTVDASSRLPAYRLTKRMIQAREKEEIPARWVKEHKQPTVLAELFKYIRFKYWDLSFTELMQKLQPTPSDYAKLILVAIYANQTGFLQQLLNKCDQFEDLKGISVIHQAIFHENWKAVKLLLEKNIDLLQVKDPTTGKTAAESLKEIKDLDPEIQKLIKS